MTRAKNEARMGQEKDALRAELAAMHTKIAALRAAWVLHRRARGPFEDMAAIDALDSAILALIGGDDAE